MSFPDKGFWIIKDGGNLTDGETVFDNSSRIENKRVQQWFSDATETELYPNKRQAVQASVGKPTSEATMASSLPWENTSGFQSGPNHFIGKLFGQDTTTPGNITGTNESRIVAENSNTTKEGICEQFGMSSSIGLSMSYTVEDAECMNHGGVRKVKDNQVKDSENSLELSAAHNIGIPLHQGYSRGSESTYAFMGQIYGKEGNNAALISHQAYSREDTSIRPMVPTFVKSDDNAISLSDSYNKGVTNTISFGAYQEDPDIDALSRPISGYDLLYNDQSPIQTSVTQGKELHTLNTNAGVNSSQATRLKPNSLPKSKSESKPAKKEAPNSFPSNVRSLIATGMLDGVPVRYVSVSREELHGTIKGSGYLCGCQSCNYSKVLNAYAFESHAGCKTKHPNNHIYFENGKTIYQIVQELKSTPQSQLFDAVKTVTGSPINQKAYRIWKESFQAATRELQRIYGKEELNL